MKTLNKFAVAGIVSAALFTGGCSTISPTLTGGMAITEVAYIEGTKESDAELPFDINEIFIRKTGSIPPMDWINGGTYESMGDSAVRIVSTYSYDEIKEAVRRVDPAKIVHPANKLYKDMIGSMGGGRYLVFYSKEFHYADPSYELMNDICNAGQHADFQNMTASAAYSKAQTRRVSRYPRCQQLYMQTRKKFKENYLKYDDLLSAYTYFVHEVYVTGEPKRLFAAGVGFDESAPLGYKSAGKSYSNDLKRKIALGIILMAYDDAVLSQSASAKNSISPLQNYLLVSSGNPRGPMDVFSCRFVVREDNNDFTYMDEPEGCVSSWAGLPMNKGIEKSLLLGRRRPSGPGILQELNMINAGKPGAINRPTKEKTFIFGGSMRTFHTDPVGYGYKNYEKIITPRDENGYPIDQINPEMCAESLYAQRNAYGSVARMALAKGLDPLDIENIYLEYVRAWKDEVYEKERTSYKFR